MRTTWTLCVRSESTIWHVQSGISLSTTKQMQDARNSYCALGLPHMSSLVHIDSLIIRENTDTAPVF